MMALRPEQFGLKSEPASNGPAPVAAAAEDVSVVTLHEFISVDEPGAESLVGATDDNLIPEGGDVMFYGDGGTAKTTLTVDLAFHFAAGTEWLGYPIARPVRVLIIENEGPRPLFRKKLARKAKHWPGPPVDDRITVLERPWASFTFATPQWRAELVRIVKEHRIDVVIAGPVVQIGMSAAGTLQEVRAFMAFIREVRGQLDRPLTVILVHHENKGGAVSGAWEGAGDTLFHTTAAGHGHTVLYVQKARWASASHHTTLKLAWTDGDGFAVEGERDLMAEANDKLDHSTPRTKREIAEALEIGLDTLDKLMNENPDAWVGPITGDEAKALGRSSKAQLWLLT